MHLQGTLLDETLAAGLTAKGTLTSVYPLMPFESVSLIEAFPTSLTPERFFPCVYTQVALQVALYCEALVAILAIVGSLPGVHHLVHFQAMGSVEALPALFTVKRPHFSMETLVVSQELL